VGNSCQMVTGIQKLVIHCLTQPFCDDEVVASEMHEAGDVDTLRPGRKLRWPWYLER
jgi:hypothetical protein